MAASARITRVVEKMKADRRTKRLEQLFNESPIYNIKISERMQEIQGIHSSRTVRRLKMSDGKFVNNLVRALENEITARSRVAEINLECSRCIASLEKAITGLRDFLLITYAEDLRMFSTKEERSRVIAIALRKYQRYVADVKSLQEVALIVLTDIDKACWNVKVIGDMLKPSSGGRELTI